MKKPEVRKIEKLSVALPSAAEPAGDWWENKKPPMVWSYHQVTKELLTTEELQYADPDKLTPNAWLVPAHATMKTPRSDLREHCAQVFEENNWKIVPDYRAVPCWDIQTAAPVLIMDIDRTPDDSGYTMVEPPAYPCRWDGSAWQADMPAIIAAKIAEIRGQAGQALDALRGEYTAGEAATWDKQYAEAVIYLSLPESMRQEVNPASYPLVTGIAQAAGIDIVDLCVKIKTKGDAYRAATAAIIGRRQRREQEINAVAEQGATLESVGSITWGNGADEPTGK